MAREIVVAALLRCRFISGSDDLTDSQIVEALDDLNTNVMLGLGDEDDTVLEIQAITASADTPNEVTLPDGRSVRLGEWHEVQE